MHRCAHTKMEAHPLVGATMSPARRARNSALRVLTLAVISSVAVTATSSVASARPEAVTQAKTVTAGRWIRTVCSSLSDWDDALYTLDTRIQDHANALESGSAPVAEAKKQLVEDLGAEVRATEQLIAQIRSVGSPQLQSRRAGQSAVNSFVSTLNDIRDALRKTERHYATSNPPTRTLAVAAINYAEAKILKAEADIGDPIEPLQAVPEFADALQNEDLCIDRSPAFIPTTFKAGDCITAPSMAAGLDYWSTVGCAQPHLAEILLVTDYPAAPQDAFPGNDAITNFVNAACIPAFREYSGVDYSAQSQYDFGWFSPSKDTWTAGDRQVICDIENADQSPMTHSPKRVG